MGASLCRTALTLAATSLVACGPPPAPPRPQPTLHSNGNAQTTGSNASTSSSESTGPGGASGLAHLRRDVSTQPPSVNAAAECTAAMTQELARYSIAGRAFHLAPICTENYNGEWVAVLATGSPQESTDVWVVLHSSTGNELHRVHRAPVGVHFTAGTIENGFVYLVGTSIATDEMPANADVLVEFPVPRIGGADPEALDLAARDLPLLGAHDRPELQRRLTAASAEVEPGARNSEATYRRIIEGGPRALMLALPSGSSIPVLRAWQTGVYERTAQLHAELDPNNGRVSSAMTIVHAIEATLDCTTGDRCLAKPAAAAARRTEAIVDSQVIFRTDGPNTRIAAVIEQGRRPDAMSNPTEDRLTSPGYDVAADRQIAEQLTLDGTIEGRVSGLTRGSVRMVAWGYAVGDRHESAIMTVSQGRAPRRFEDVVFNGMTTGARELAFRDIERNLEPEVVSITQLPGNSEAVGVGTLLWPPAVVDRATYPRLDVMRIALDAANLADADRAFRTYNPPQADQTATCAALERLTTNPTGRSLASATAGGLVRIDYTNAGQPLRGNVRRETTNELRREADGNAVLGPFVGARCADLVCDWFQGYCRRPANGPEVGYLFLSGRRNAPLWGVARLAGGGS